MPDQLQLRGGTTAEHSTFTGAIKEVTVDTTKKTAVVHDGTTAGGIALLRQDGSNSALALGSEGTPSLKWDANTGIFSPGEDQLAVATNGAQRINIEADGDINIDGGGVFYDATNNRLAIGSSTFSLDSKLKVKQSSGVYSYNGLWVERLSDESGIGLGYDTASDCFALTTTYGSTGAYKGIAFITSGFERGRWDTSGRFLVGTSTYRTVGTYGYEAKTQIEGTSSVVAGLTLTGNRNDGLGPYFVLGRSRGTTAGSSTAVQNGDELGTIQFCGADGTDLETAGALIRAEVDGTATINAGSFVASRRY